MPISVDRHGSGPIPVVFLHGYCEGNWVWKNLLPHLPEEWTCWLIELPGFGNSEQLPVNLTADITLADIGEMIRNELVCRSVHQPWIVGHSLGGYVALAMADTNPVDVSGLILFHSSPFADPPERRRIRDQVIAFVQNYGPKPFLFSMSEGLFRERGPAWRYFSDHADGVSAESISVYARMMRDRPDRSSLVVQGRIPIGIVAGRFDRLIPLATVEQMAALHPSVRVEELTASAHVGMLEEPDASAKILISLISQEHSG